MRGRRFGARAQRLAAQHYALRDAGRSGGRDDDGGPVGHGLGFPGDHAESERRSARERVAQCIEQGAGVFGVGRPQLGRHERQKW